ncbi:hypothetical protein [Streptomyces sp. NPDC045470]|uniref:hypothetical protein n=1 Tax=unclassified Streptomyces TaxID=2593676 RepID=UPI0033EF4573
MPITGQNVDDWVNEMARLTARFVAGFETAYGYPPGEHHVSKAPDHGGHGSLDAALSGDLAVFYSHVDRITLPDVGPGFFVDSAEEVTEGFDGAQPTKVIGPPDRDVVTFGSDGGGALFAIDRRTDEVVRLEGGSLVGAVYDPEERGVQVIAQGIEGYMRFLRNELMRQLPPEGR